MSSRAKFIMLKASRTDKWADGDRYDINTLHSEVIISRYALTKPNNSTGESLCLPLTVWARNPARMFRIRGLGCSPVALDRRTFMKA